MPGVIRHRTAATLIGVIAGTCLLSTAGGRVGALLAKSLQLGLLASAVAVPLGATLAVLLVKTDASGRRLAWLLLGGMLLLPLSLHAAAWQAGFGLLGWATQNAAGGGPIAPWLSGLRGAAWVHAMAATPWVTLIVGAALHGVAAGQEESALLETSPASVLRRVTAGRAASGALLGVCWTVMSCGAEMAVSDLFNVRTFAEEVYTQSALSAFNAGAAANRGAGDWSLGAWGLSSGVTLLAASAAVIVANASRWLLEPNEAETQQRWVWRLGPWRPACSGALGLLLILTAASPIANLAYQAGVRVDRVEEGWRRGWSAIKLVERVARAPWEHRRELAPSIGLAATVATSVTLAGVLLAWRAGRGAFGRWLAASAVGIGLAVPGPLLGIAAIRLLNQPAESPLVCLTWLYDETWFAAWLVQTIRATPLATLAVWPALASVPSAFVEGAMTDGAGRWSAFWRVAVPTRLPVIGLAWVVGFAASLGEVSATLLVLPPGPQTVTARVSSLLHYGVDDRVAALCLLLLGGCLLLGAAGVCLAERARLAARGERLPR